MSLCCYVELDDEKRLAVMKRLVVFDVCGTLYESNTTFDFIQFVKKNKIIKLLNNWFIKYAFVFLGKSLNKDIYRFLYVRQLKGMSRIELDKLANEFVESWLIGKEITVSHELLMKCKNNNQTCLIISASLDVVVCAICKKLGVDAFYASRLEFVDGIATGYLATDMLGNKHKIEEIVNLSEIEMVVTDNISDFHLVSMAKKSFILSKEKNIDFWKSKNISVDLILK